MTTIVRTTGTMGGWKRDGRGAQTLRTLAEVKWHGKVSAERITKAERLWRTGAVMDDAVDRPDLALACALSSARWALGRPLGVEGVATMLRRADVGTSLWRAPAAVELDSARLTSPDDVIEAVALDGPVLLGLPWRDGLDQADPHGHIHYHGTVLGPHVVLLVGVSASAVRVLNAWGTGWASLGRAWLPRADLATIFAAKCEAVGLSAV